MVVNVFKGAKRTGILLALAAFAVMSVYVMLRPDAHGTNSRQGTYSRPVGTASDAFFNRPAHEESLVPSIVQTQDKVIPGIDSKNSPPVAASGMVDGAQKSEARNTSGAPFGIPLEIPAHESDEPLEAGFPPQWVAQHMYMWSRAQLIASEKKRSEDGWAYGVEYELRETIRVAENSRAPILSRVFCNQFGCLCYLEGSESDVNFAFREVTRALKGTNGWGKDYGIDPAHIASTGRGGLIEGESVWHVLYIPAPNVP